MRYEAALCRMDNCLKSQFFLPVLIDGPNHGKRVSIFTAAGPMTKWACRVALAKPAQVCQVHGFAPLGCRGQLVWSCCEVILAVGSVLNAAMRSRERLGARQDY